MPLDTSSAITLYGVTCWDEGTREQFLYDSPSTATRQILCGWTDRVPLINALRGEVLQLSPSVVEYLPPGVYPDAPWLYCYAIEVEGIPGEDGLSVGPNGLVAYKYARIRVTYRSLPYLQGIETGVLSVDYGAEILALPSSRPSLQFSDTMGGDVPVELNPPLRITAVTFRQTRMNLPTIPVDAIIAATDTVNSAEFLGAAAGTVKFDGASSQRRLFAGGSPGWDLTYVFSYVAMGWNVVYDPVNGWRPVTFKATGNAPFGNYDFNLLFL